MSDLTPETLAELRRLAEAATPGPWEATIFDSGHSKFEFEASVCTQDVGDSICRMEGLLRTTDNERYRTDGSLDALYIAAASPDVVLGLLDRLAHMTEARDNARAEVERLIEAQHEGRWEEVATGDYERWSGMGIALAAAAVNALPALLDALAAVTERAERAEAKLAAIKSEHIPDRRADA